MEHHLPGHVAVGPQPFCVNFGAPRGPDLGRLFSFLASIVERSGIVRQRGLREGGAVGRTAGQSMQLIVRGGQFSPVQRHFQHIVTTKMVLSIKPVQRPCSGPVMPQTSPGGALIQVIERGRQKLSVASRLRSLNEAAVGCWAVRCSETGQQIITWMGHCPREAGKRGRRNLALHSPELASRKIKNAAKEKNISWRVIT